MLYEPEVLKVTLNKFHKKRKSDISLINWVSYRLQILFWCPDNQNEFNDHTNVQPHCGEFGSTISVCMRNSAFGSSVHQC
jgi:hypothetical protein